LLPQGSPGTLWERACSRRRPYWRPSFSRMYTHQNCGSWLACEGGLIADLFLVDVRQSHCGSEPARDGGLRVGLFLDGVHIHSCGNGHLGFRPYGDSLFFQTPKKSKQKKARPERPAPRLGSAFLRSGIHLGALPSGLLRYDLHAMCSTASNGAARQSPDEHLHSASRRGGQSKIKSRRANARPNEW
jgi:hypothetical protein